MLSRGRRIAALLKPDDRMPPHGLVRLQEEQVAYVRRYKIGMLVSTLCNGLVCAYAIWQSRGAPQALIWAIALALALLPPSLRRLRRRPAGGRRATARELIEKLTFNAFLLGCCWGAVPYFFFRPEVPQLQLVITCLSAGMLSGGVFALSSVPRAAIAYGLPIALAFLIAMTRIDDQSATLVQILVLSFVSVLLIGMGISYTQLRGRVLMQIDTERQVRRDPITGLANRLGAQELMQAEIARGGGLAIASLEVNGLDQILGQADADFEHKLLPCVVERIQGCLGGREALARMAEDRFLILIPEANGDLRAEQLPERLEEAFAAPIPLADRLHYLSVSLGISLAPRDGTDPVSLLRHADIALHEAKRRGDRSFEFFAPELDEQLVQRRKMASDLRKAVASNAFHVVYQPICELHSGRIVACEALLRWNHPKRGAISPVEFIPLAEEMGLIQEIGLWVLRQAVRDALDWPAHVHVSVNVSPVQLETGVFAEELISILQRENFPPERLSIEITETALFRDEQLAVGSVRKISSHGVALSLDDFGTGYSSLNYIRHYPLNYIKLDKSFVNDVLVDAGCTAIIHGMIRMAEDLRVDIVAEGVETQEQFDWLMTHGCSHAQGYLISRPISAVDILELLGRKDQLAIIAAE